MKNKILHVISKPWIALFSILLLQAGIAMVSLRNTLFQDEALYLYAGGEIVKSVLRGIPVAEHYGLFFSAYPRFYPAIAGILDMFFGVEGVRIFSLLCVMGATLCVYFITRQLFNRQSALFATILFAFQGSILFIGRLATFDALCLFLLSLSVTLAVRAGKDRADWIPLVLGPLLILAVLAKYAALFFAPFIIVIFVYRSYKEFGILATFLRSCVMVLAATILALLLYFNFDKDVIQGLLLTTTNRVAFIKTARVDLLIRVIYLGGMMFGLAVLGILSNRRRMFLGVLLLGASLLVPTYHIYKGEIVSLDKHVGFSVFFIAPFAGYILSRIATYQNHYVNGKYWLAATALCLLTASLGVKQGQWLYTEWPSTVRLTQVFRTQVRPGDETSPGSGHYLSEQFEVSRYYMQPYTDGWQWVGLDFFEYTDKQHHYFIGKDAYVAAIREGYFDVIELDYGYNAKVAYAITSEIKSSKNFTLISKIPYTNAYGTGYFWVWRRNTSNLANSKS